MSHERRALLIESPGIRALVAAGQLERTDADPVITPPREVFATALAASEVKRGRRRGRVREAIRAEADRRAGVEIVRHRALTGEG